MKRLSYHAAVWLSLGLFLLVGAWLVRHSQATLITHWMLVHEVQDFATPSAMWSYVQDLRTIPIVLALLEFASAIAYGAWRRRGATPDRGAMRGLPLTAESRRRHCDCAVAPSSLHAVRPWSAGPAFYQVSGVVA